MALGLFRQWDSERSRDLTAFSVVSSRSDLLLLKSGGAAIQNSITLGGQDVFTKFGRSFQRQRHRGRYHWRWNWSVIDFAIGVSKRLVH
jgi:hypothetical protein